MVNIDFWVGTHYELSERNGWLWAVINVYSRKKGAIIVLVKRDDRRFAGPFARRVTNRIEDRISDAQNPRSTT